jgi:hypothetical protein
MAASRSLTGYRWPDYQPGQVLFQFFNVAQGGK